MSTSARNFLLGQITFYLGLLVSIVLQPQGLSTNNGISYYGVYTRTFVPYALGFLGAAFFGLRAANYLRNQELKPIRLVFLAYVPLAIVLISTPYSISRYVDWFHTIAGSILFSGQLVLSGWLVWKMKCNVLAILLTFVELAAGIASLIYLKPTHGFLLQTQTLFQLAFGALILFSLPKLEKSTQ